MAEAPSSTSSTTTVSEPTPEPKPASKSGSGSSCPICGAKTEPYEGENPFKQGTAWCPEHGRQAMS